MVHVNKFKGANVGARAVQLNRACGAMDIARSARGASTAVAGSRDRQAPVNNSRMVQEKFLVRNRILVGVFAAVILICSTPVHAAVGPLDNWTLLDSSNPAANSFTIAAGNITVSAGSQRLLVVAAVFESGAGGTLTNFNATLGTTAMTAIASSLTTQREVAKVWYLPEASIPGGAAALAVSGTYNQNVSGMHIYWASFSGVDQTTPINDSNANYNNGANVTFGAQIDFLVGGLTFYATGNGGTPATMGAPAPAGLPAFAQRLVTTSDGHSSFTADAGVHGAAGSYAGGTNITFGGSTSTRSAVVVASLRPAPSANLAVTKTATSPVYLGDIFTYTVNVTNGGPSTATSVAMTDTLPVNTEFVFVSSTQGSCSGPSPVTCSLGSIANGATAIVTIFVKAKALGAISNTASATAAELDPNLANNSSTVGTTILQINTADVAVTKTALPASVAVGANVTYTLTVTNNGPDTANAITVTDPLPAGMTWVSTTPTTGSCSGSVVVSCSLGNMANGASATITIVATANSAGAKLNQAGLTIDTSTTYDPIPTNDSAAVTHMVTGGPPTLPLVCLPAPPIGPAPGPLSGVINTYFPGTATVAAGATSITLGLARALPGNQTPIAIGDLLMVIQMQDATIDSSQSDSYGDGTAGGGAGALVVNAGAYEFVRATNGVPLAGGALTLQGAGAGTGLVNAYTNADASATKGQARFQVVRVPQYTTATLNAVTAAPWLTNTAAPVGLGTGGILAIDVQGVLTINSGVAASVDGLGFRGGAGRQLAGGAGANTDYRTLSTINANGSKGEGNAGTPAFVNSAAGPLATNQPNDGYPNGSMARGAPGNAGGGSTDGNPAANDQNSGGGGGSNGGAGGTGGHSWNTNLDRGGVGAAVTPAITKLVLGGGGGAGTRNNSPGLPLAAGGAAGGGLMVIRAGQFSIAAGAILSADGTAAYNGTENDGGGGGGAGGSVIVTVTSGTMSGLSVRARGGRGGDSWTTEPPGASPPGARHGPGGGGGGGVIVYTNTVTPPALNVSGGASGVTTTALDNYFAQAGGPGQALTAAPGLIPGIGSLSDCVIDLTITLTHSPATVAPGATVPFIATVTNLGLFNPTSGSVSVTITIDPGLAFNGLASGSGWTCAAPAGQSVTCTRSNALAAQTSYPPINFNATVIVPGPATLSGNSATVSGGGDVNLANNTDTDVVGVRSPTLARLRSFEAIRSGNTVYLTWETSFESDNLGFLVYREVAGVRQLLTHSPIAGSALQVRSRKMISGQSYSWADRNAVRQDDVFYWLEDIAIDGSRNWTGPAIAYSTGEAEARFGTIDSNSPTLDGLGRETSTGAGQPSPPGFGIERRITFDRADTATAKAWERGWTAPSRNAAKLAVTSDGWYRVTKAEMVAAGFDPGVNPKRIQLLSDGKDQPILVNDGDDGIFDPADSIEFYGVGIDSAYDAAHVYWVIRNDHGTRIGTARQESLPAAPASFPFTLERKDRTVFFRALTNNGDEENFFGPVLSTTPVTVDLKVQNLDTAPGGDSPLEIALQGITGETLHLVAVQLNGNAVGTVSFNNQERATTKLSVANALLHEGINTLTMTALGGSNDVSLIDYVRLTYPHTYQLDSGALRMTVPAGRRVTIEGLTDTSLRVIDVSDPSMPKEVEVDFGSEGAPQSPSFGVNGSKPATLLAFTSARVQSPSAIVSNTRSSLRDRIIGADLVVVTHASLQASLTPLVELRRSQGLITMVVDVTDVYDEFAYGQRTPYAIRDFLTHAMSTWPRKPRFVLLAGDASFDPKGYLGLGKYDLVPSKLIPTAYLKASSDDWFADRDSNGLPELAIGRLPARTAAEASTMVGKILSREAALALNPAWASSTLLVAGKNEDFNFETASTTLETLLPAGVTAQKTFEGLLGASTRNTIISQFNSGQLLVNFAGHGSVAVWSNRPVFNGANATALTNGSKLPVVISMTCLNGFFDDLYVESLAESFLKAPNGGAAAVWASTTLTEPAPQMLMNQEFFRLVFQVPSITLGEAMVRAKAVIPDQDVRRSWVLLGDPSMRLR